MNLEEISDRLEIQGLMVEYCDAIDTRNWDALDDVFTSDAIIDYSEMVGVKGTLPIQACQHIISTSKIKVEDDRRTICTNSMVFKPNGQFFGVGLWYRDEFVRTEKGWRISSRYEESCWRYNLPDGLLD